MVNPEHERLVQLAYSDSSPELDNDQWNAWLIHHAEDTLTQYNRGLPHHPTIYLHGIAGNQSVGWLVDHPHDLITNRSL